MNDITPVDRRPRRLREWMRTSRWLKIAGATILLIIVVGVVPPFRRAAALVTSKIILTLARPFAPNIRNFAELSKGTRIEAADGSVLVQLGGAETQPPVRIRDLRPYVTHAVLAAEDERFFRHSGVDPAAVFRAFVRTAQGRVQGGSTITQQLAKINYTKSEHTLFRKLREVEYASALERKYTKTQLLERYLDQVYFGEGAYGISAASNVFFGADPQHLTVSQAAVLAGKIRSPEGLDPRRHPDQVRVRRDQVLDNMRRNGWLTPESASAAKAEPITLAPETTEQQSAIAPHFVEYVKREAARLDQLGGSAESRSKQLYTGGYTIRTTLDPLAFQEASDAVRANLAKPDDPATAVVSVKPGDGAIMTLFGGFGFDRKFDVASQGRRQPGSAFKPFVYLAALRDGIDPRSTFDASAPKRLSYQGETYTVNNAHDGEAAGPVSVDEAMVKSINTIYAQLILQVGPSNVTKVAETLGVADVTDNVGARPAIALGGLHRGVSPLEMAAAYATFAAKGIYAEPYSIAGITDRHGHVVYAHSVKTHQAYDAKEVGVLNAVLQQVVQRGTGTAAAIGRPVAGKTGTTEKFGDAWFAGFVPQIATAVWVGYPDKVAPMTQVHGQQVFGGTFPARIWAAYMKKAVASLPVASIFTSNPDVLSLSRLGTTTTTTTASPATSSTTAAAGGITTSTVSGQGGTTSTTRASGRTTTTTTPCPTTTTSSSSPTTTTSSTTTTTTTKPNQTTTTTTLCG